MLEPEVQLVPPTKNVIMAALTPKSVVQLTALRAFETGRKLNPVCCHYVDFSNQPSISVAQERSFPKSNNSHTMHRFIIFMGINKDDKKPVDIF